MSEQLYTEPKRVGKEVFQAITKMEDEQGCVATGNVVRRACQWMAEGACKEICQLAEAREAFHTDITARQDVTTAGEKRLCADLNLWGTLRELDLQPEGVLMVGVTDRGIGFADKLDEYEALKDNPYGWRELPGFDAFFALEGEVGALGRRLADCADINFEFKDSEGKTVFGFEHGSRPNMYGASAYKFEYDDHKNISFTEAALGQAINHYGADPTSVHIRLAAAIQGHNFTKHFDSYEKMEEHLPGWLEDGFVTNATNPEWQPGDPVVESDTWHADTRGMIVRDIRQAMEKLGVPEVNLDCEGIIDPGDSKGAHSSHQFSEKYGDTRDLYITYPDTE